MTAVCVSLLLPTQACLAQAPPEPSVVIAMAPLGEQLSDMKHLVNASGFGNLNFMIQSQVKFYTGGISRKNASGAYLYFEGEDTTPKWLVMLAIDDGETVLDQISNFADIDEDGDFIKVLTDNDQEFLIKETDGYFLISDNEEMFNYAPTNPAAELETAAGDFNLALKAFGQRVPEELRAKGVEAMKEAFSNQMEADGADPEMIQAQLKQLESFVNDTDEIMMGYKVDEESNLLSAKFTLTGMPGSEIAKRVAVVSPPGESEFTGFLNDKAAVDSNLRYQLHEDDVKVYVGYLEQARQQMIDELDADGEFTDEELATISTATDTIADSLKATLEGKLIDSGALLMMDEKSFSFVGGSTLAEAAEFEEAVKSLIELMEVKSDGVIEAKFNSGTFEDITLHTITANIPEDEDEFRKMFGSQVEITLGVSPDKVYVAVGKDPLTALTDAIERSKTPKPSKYGQLMYNVRLAPILRFAGGVTGEQTLADMAATLEDSNSGRVTIWSKAIPNGIETNMEMQDGILALIKEGFDAFQQGAFQNFDDMDEF